MSTKVTNAKKQYIEPKEIYATSDTQIVAVYRSRGTLHEECFTNVSTLQGVKAVYEDWNNNLEGRPDRFKRTFVRAYKVTSVLQLDLIEDEKDN